MISNTSMNSNWSHSPETLNSGQNRQFFVPCDPEIWWMTLNKANLRDLIAATSLVILLKLDSNRRFFRPCDLEIWWMTPKNNKTPHLSIYALCIISNPSVNSNWSYSPETLSAGQNWWFYLDDVTLKFDGWPWKTTGHLLLLQVFCIIL